MKALRFILILACLAALCVWQGLEEPVRATGKSSAQGPGLPRQIRGDLRFMNPVLAGALPDLSAFGIDTSGKQGYELGAMKQGDDIERIINVAGGEKAYTITSPSLESVLAALDQAAGLPTGSSTLTLNPAGVLTGVYRGPTPADVYFEVRAEDAEGVTVAGIFHLGVVAHTNFQFAQSALPTGQHGLDYVTRIQLVNAPASAEIHTVGSSITVDGQSFNDWEILGLTLHKDGALYGRPLHTGNVIFTAKAVDPKNASVSTGQSFNFDIEPMDYASSRIFAINCNIRGKKPTKGYDTFRFRGVVDLGGKLLANLVGTELTVRVSGGSGHSDKGYGVVMRGTFDGNGRVRTIKTNETPYDLKAQLGWNGYLRIAGSGLDLFDAVNAPSIANQSKANVIIEVRIGNELTCEAIEMETRASKTYYSMFYRLQSGSTPTGRSLAGNFQTVFVRGKDVNADNINAEAGVAYFLQFFATPRFGISGGNSIAGSGSATIRIGFGFEENVPFTDQGQRLKYKAASGFDSRLHTLVLSPTKFKHFLRTYKLSEFDSDIPQAKEDLGKQLFIFEMETDGGFKGGTSRVIFPLGGRYSDKP